MARQQKGMAGAQQPAFADPGDETAEEQPTTTEVAAEEGTIPNLFAPEEEPNFPEAEDGALPDWARAPGDLSIPSGIEVACFLFKADWTVNRLKGDRTCIVWPLTDRDERVALARCAHNPLMAGSELAKQMVRSFDGFKTDWGKAGTGKLGDIDLFWSEIGPKCRGIVKRFHAETHSMKPGELAYFFENCVVLRVGG